jgi:uncharacterized protein
MSAKIRTEFPFAIREIENIFIPLSNGIRLTARLWMPENAEQTPLPAILEYLPYRKNDDMAVRDSLNHRYLAGHGYAAVRVDMRGSGDSDGILFDEYLEEEIQDGLEILEWLEQQPWCNGKVGMFGISWGGFNSLQIAARRPKQLKAIMPIGFTDDRYATDVHYQGGSVLASDMLSWSSIMFAFQALPPDPNNRADWREEWLKRLKDTPPYVEAWLSHQRRDAYWKHGSVCEKYSDIKIPVYAVSGWGDAYKDGVLRLLENLTCPKKALVGPWSHGFPQRSEPGPQIGFLQEMLRWWDYWLKDMNTGIMNEPTLRVWMQESVSPQTYYAQQPGRWVGETTYPSSAINTQQLFLRENNLLTSEASSQGAKSILGAQHHGLEAGVWCAYGSPGDYPADQRREDGLCLCFDGETVREAVEILGYPHVNLELSSDQPIAQVVARLCDVSLTGESLLVSRGNLNLTHRENHEFPEKLRPHKRYTLNFPLGATAHRLQPGHHWRLALSPTYWFHLWPSPKPVTLTIYMTQASFVSLPIRIVENEIPLPDFQEPEIAQPLETTELREASREIKIIYDLATQTHIWTDTQDSGRVNLHYNKTEQEAIMINRYSVGDDPLSAKAECEHKLEYSRPESSNKAWNIRIHTYSTMTCNEKHFYVTNLLEAFESDKKIFENLREFKVARDHV